MPYMRVDRSLDDRYTDPHYYIWQVRRSVPSPETRLPSLEPDSRLPTRTSTLGNPDTSVRVAHPTLHINPPTPTSDSSPILPPHPHHLHISTPFPHSFHNVFHPLRPFHPCPLRRALVVPFPAPHGPVRLQRGPPPDADGRRPRVRHDQHPMPPRPWPTPSQAPQPRPPPRIPTPH